MAVCYSCCVNGVFIVLFFLLFFWFEIVENKLEKEKVQRKENKAEVWW